MAEAFRIEEVKVCQFLLARGLRAEKNIKGTIVLHDDNPISSREYSIHSITEEG